MRKNDIASSSPNFLSRRNSCAHLFENQSRNGLPTRKLRHQCEGLSIAEIEAFDTLASGSEPFDFGDALSGLARLGYLKATGWTLDSGDESQLQARHRYTIPISLHLAWCEWAWATSYAPRSAPSLSTKPPPDQLSLFT